MSHKTNSIALRINSSVGWKSHIFPKKKFYTRDTTLLLRIYLLLKGYLALYDYKLLFYELKSTHLIKIIYLTVIKQKEIKRKKTIWKPKNSLNKLQYKNVKYLIYTKSFFKNTYVHTNTKKSDLASVSMFKKHFNYFFLKKKSQSNNNLQHSKIYKFLKYFGNINSRLLNIKRLYKTLHFIEHILNIYWWKSNFYKTVQKNNTHKKYTAYINFLYNFVNNLDNKTKYTTIKNKTFTILSNKYAKQLIPKIQKYQHRALIKEKIKIINKNNKRYYFTNKSTVFYFSSKRWTIRLRKKRKNITKIQKNLIYQKKERMNKFIQYINYFNKQIKNKKHLIRNKIINFKNKYKMFKLYYQSIPQNVKFYKKRFNIKNLIILKSRKNKFYKIKAKNKLIKNKIKKKIYKNLTLMSNFYLNYYLANWIKYYFKLNICIKINNPLISRYMGMELDKEMEKKLVYINYKYLKQHKKNYYTQTINFKKKIINTKKYNLTETYITKPLKQDSFASILNIATTYIEPQLIADYIASELQRSKAHSPILNNIRKQLQVNQLGKLLGIRIAINGRFNSSDRTRLEYIVHGRVPRNSYKDRITYALGHSYARIGSFGVKIWLFY